MTINVHKNKQRSCKHLKSCRIIHEFWTPYLTGWPIKIIHEWGVLCVCYCWISTIYDINFLSKPCRTSQTSKTPPSRRTSNHKHRANCSKLRVIAKMTNDKWPFNVLIINDFVVILSFEIFLNSELTSVNVDIRGKKQVFQQAIFSLLKSEECIVWFI